METVSHALQEARRRLVPVSESAALDAQVLLAHIAGRDRAWLLAHPEAPLTPAQSDQYERDLQQLEAGIPLPYVLGEWEFYGRKFHVTPDVLIPRPETELLVELALGWLKAHPANRLAADVGTGSGCIAVTLAAEVADLVVDAFDISPAALAVAKANAARWRCADHIRFVLGNLLEDSSTSYPLICANLPYIPTATLGGLAVYGREPTLALDGGADGLNLIERLLEQLAAERIVRESGVGLFEIEATQGESAALLAMRHFPEAKVEVLADLAGNPRLLVIQT